ncbi:MAG: sigma-54-dependent transcriptional regulator [Myxococcaceae bacterium]
MKILVVDDELSMREYLELLLVAAGYSVAAAPGVPQAISQLKSGGIDLVVSDMKLGSGSGFEVLRAARELPEPPEVILITAYGTPATAVEAMRLGAYDYICKPFDNDELKLLVGKALEKRAILQENQQLRRTVDPSGRRALLGESKAMASVWQLIERVASSPRSTVLITGESGTGKELVARAVHWRSARAGNPFIAVNCGALAESVLESELFGHVKGSFTGAIRDRPGLLSSAGDGTVFLDEIGEISPAMQVKLLRVLQERTVKPVGSSQEIPFGARVLAATNKELEAEVKAGRFREDLFFRLNVIGIRVPPLRERPDDIPALATHFLKRMAEELGRPRLAFAPETLRLMQEYRFPGNVRQLENVVERAATLSPTDEIFPTSLPAGLSGGTEPSRGDVPARMGEGFSLDHLLDSEERRYLLESLRLSDGVKVKAAELLGISFRSLRYRLAKHGLVDPDDKDARG